MKAFIAVVMAVLLAACAPQTYPSTQGTYTDTNAFTPGEDLAAAHFASQEELEAFLAQTRAADADFYYRGGVAMDTGAAAPSKSSLAVAESANGGSGYSTTNNQVATVDEADIIKTDGEYIYTVSGTTLFIVKAGEDAEVVSRIELESQPSGIFVEGDRLAVMGYYYNLSYFKKIGYSAHDSMTYLNVYDISDKEEPQLVKDFKFEGNYFQARLHEGDIYLVLTSTPDADYPLPIIMEGTTRSAVAIDDIYYFPVPYNYIQYVTVHSINLASADTVDSKTVAVEGANTLYMSEDNIYLAYTQYVNEWQIRQDIMVDVLDPKLTSEDRELIEKIKAVDNDVLSRYEKESKIFQVYNEYFMYLEPSEQQELNDVIDARLKRELEKYDSMEYTIINKIGVDSGSITVGPTGQVAGHLNNQFSMDEYEGVLRVATTTSARWNWWGRPVLMVEPAVAEDAPMPVDIDGGIGDGEASVETDDEKMRIAPTEPSSDSVNTVYTLDENLDVIDSLSGIAKGETIFSTRFVGDRLYMVTFRQVDPFFVIDLSDASDIRTMGELKIPGFSRYLHPYDENTIIGLGRDATETGRQQGLKIAIFDVTDVTDPEQLASWVAEDEYSQSTAEWEHKAFLFDREKELLVIPAYTYSYDYVKGTSGQGYNGAMVFSITRDDIEMRGIIDHASSQQYYGSLVERSLYIGDLLYTKSPGLLRVNSLDDLSGVANVTLSGKNASPYPIY